MTLSNGILVAVDFSPCSAAALRRARRIAAWHRAPLTVLHVVTPIPIIDPSPLGPMRLGIEFPPVEELVRQARRRWHEFAREWDGPENADFIIEVGHARDRILEAVRAQKPRLLVIGAHGRLDAYRGVGTTAAACVQRAATQVLVVRPKQLGPFRSVVACVDFSETSRVALENAISVATQDSAALHILHVYSDPWHGIGPTDEIRRNMPDFAERYCEAMERRLREFCAPLTHEVNALKPVFHAVEAPRHADGITAFLPAHQCDLAVLGTRGKFNMRDYFWGSTAEGVVREAHCSVLAVKPPTFAELQSYEPLADTASGNSTEPLKTAASLH